MQKEPILFNGLRLYEHPNLPRTPINGMEKKPWWLTDEAYREHQDWCGNFFGWTQEIFILPGDIGLASLEHMAMIRNVLTK